MRHRVRPTVVALILVDTKVPLSAEAPRLWKRQCRPRIRRGASARKIAFLVRPLCASPLQHTSAQEHSPNKDMLRRFHTNHPPALLVMRNTVAVQPRPYCAFIVENWAENQLLALEHLSVIETLLRNHKEPDTVEG